MGSALGTFILANPTKVILDTGKSIPQAILDKVPHRREYLDILGLLHALLREIRSKARNEVELHIDSPSESPIFTAFPSVLNNKEMTSFICDYCPLFIIGNVRTFEIESLMDEEIAAIKYDRLKPYHALTAIGDGLPALGIVAAVLGVIKAMGALDQSPELLGGLIGAAMVGTLRGHLRLLWHRHAARLQGEGRAHQGMPRLSRHQADAARLHEWRAAAGCDRARPQIHRLLRPSDHRRGRKRGPVRRRRQGGRMSMADAAAPAPAREAIEPLVANGVASVGRLSVLRTIFEECGTRFAKAVFETTGAELELLVKDIQAVRVSEMKDAGETIAIASVYAAPELRAKIIIGVDVDLALTLIDVLFGSNVSSPFTRADRTLTRVESRAAEFAMATMLDALQASLAKIVKSTFKLEGVEQTVEWSLLGSRGSVVVIGRFVLQSGGRQGEAIVVIPRSALDPLPGCAVARAQWFLASSRDSAWARKLRDQLVKASVRVSATMEKRGLTLGDVARFHVGQIIDLPFSPTSLIPLKSAERALFKCVNWGRRTATTPCASRKRSTVKKVFERHHRRTMTPPDRRVRREAIDVDNNGNPSMNADMDEFEGLGLGEGFGEMPEPPPVMMSQPAPRRATRGRASTMFCRSPWCCRSSSARRPFRSPICSVWVAARSSRSTAASAIL